MPSPKPPRVKAEKLTKKQENFARAFVKTGVASDAYREAYDTGTMTDPSIHVAASRLLSNAKVALRIDQLRAPGLKKAGMDAEETILEIASVAKTQCEDGPKYSDKLNALAMMAKHHGLFEKDNRQKAAPIVAINIALVE